MNEIIKYECAAVVVLSLMYGSITIGPHDVKYI